MRTEKWSKLDLCNRCWTKEVSEPCEEFIVNSFVRLRTAVYCVRVDSDSAESSWLSRLSVITRTTTTTTATVQDARRDLSSPFLAGRGRGARVGHRPWSTEKRFESRTFQSQNFDLVLGVLASSPLPVTGRFG